MGEITQLFKRGRPSVRSRTGSSHAKLLLPEVPRWEDGSAAPYVIVPAWWRHGILTAMRPREAQVYLYVICWSHIRHGNAFPSARRIATDVGIAPTSLAPILRRLYKLGFLVPAPYAIKGHGRVLQRPSQAYTLHVMLTSTDQAADVVKATMLQACRLIRKFATPDGPKKNALKPVLEALSRLLGSQQYELLHRRLRSTPESRHLDELIALLDSALARSRERALIEESADDVPF